MFDIWKVAYLGKKGKWELFYDKALPRTGLEEQI